MRNVPYEYFMVVYAYTIQYIFNRTLFSWFCCVYVQKSLVFKKWCQIPSIRSNQKHHQQQHQLGGISFSNTASSSSIDSTEHSSSEKREK